jgi:DNA polymerase-1
MDAFNTGKDLYMVLASQIFNKPYAECGDGTQERKRAKVILLAVMYGISPKGISDSIKCTKKEAEKIISDFYVNNPKVRKWMDDHITFCRKTGYVEIFGGRKRRLKEINASDKWARARAERQCINALVQGAAAIQTKLTMVAIYHWCLTKGFEMLFSIHDEIAILTPETISREDIEEFNEIMINTVELSIPNKSDIEISRRWAEGMSVDQFLTGEVDRKHFNNTPDYLEQKQIVENAWQEAIAN